jgi:hypothetical protein
MQIGTQKLRDEIAVTYVRMRSRTGFTRVSRGGRTCPQEEK